MTGAATPTQYEQFIEPLLAVLQSYKRGNFSKRMPAGLTGVEGKVADLLNEIIDMGDDLVTEVEQASQLVGRRGKLEHRLDVHPLKGSWKKLAVANNNLIEELVTPTNELIRVIEKVAMGDLTESVALQVNDMKLQGQHLRSAKLINTMVSQLRAFSDEVIRVAREVGTEGILGGQADVPGVSGTWKSLTDNVNGMASSLTAQVRNIAEVTTAVAEGDLTQKITVDAQGEVLALKETINRMVGQLGAFGDEVTRVAREVGTEGILGGQANVPGVSGTWKDLTDNVNGMASSLTAQVRNVAEVTTAVAEGDLTQKITVDAQGEVLALKETINRMVDQLGAFGDEVTRVAREVGTEGILGGQANVPGVSGTWKDLTDNVNGMASSLTAQVRNIAEVTTAVAEGDLTQKITVDAQGEVLALKETINRMVDQLGAFGDEVTRVAREVGTEGILGGQANVPGVSGTWKDLTDNVNGMADSLTAQVRNIAEVTTAVALGDLTQKITVDAQGEVLALKETINRMVDQLGAFGDEVTRVAREVGTEGILGGQANVPGVSGTWKDLTDNVNGMADSLTAQVRNVAEVTTAVAQGDLTQKITVTAQGEVLALKNTINNMVDQLGAFGDEVSRVAREVGTEGILGGQANVPGVSGTWKDLTDNVNGMATNLTAQVRNIAEVTTAVAQGDLTQTITVDAQGEVLALKETINRMVDQLGSFGDEVTRVAREVGTEGILGGQANVPGVSGTWKDLTDNVNAMASNLTAQVRNIAEVTTAVAQGDLTQTITVDAQGEVLTLKETINNMVDQLGAFGDEVSRVAREVGTEGILGGQAHVPGVSGTWKDLTDNVNGMATNLTTQVRNIAEVTTAVANGHLNKKITVDARGEVLTLKETINTMVDLLRSFADEVTRVAREVGTEGVLGGQAHVPGVAGTWKDLTDNVNGMAANLTTQVRNIAEVTTAVANGDLSRKITVDVSGEVAALKTTINTMVDQLRSFADEVTRVAREVGTEGILGGQANVPGVSGTWKDLTDNVNGMATNLTDQVRGISKLMNAVAAGDLSKRFTLDAKGEVAELADTINAMTDTLSVFSDQVIRVAQDVGIEGILGGQAKVPGVAGTWKNLTDNVNAMASNLTTQVRAIADVAVAVTDGDYSRNIQVEANGEVDDLKKSINLMIDTLRQTTLRSQEQDWLKTNLARVGRLVQEKQTHQTLAQQLFTELAELLDVHVGAYYQVEEAQSGEENSLNFVYGYAFNERKHMSTKVQFGQGLVGQCAVEKQRILLTAAPEDYIEVSSGLGSAKPLNIMLLPVIYEDKVKAVIEFASFNRFSKISQLFVDQLGESMGMILNAIDSNTRTKALLMQSQQLATELQNQQDELKNSNEELEEKAYLLEQQKSEVEKKNAEIESTRLILEERAQQLSLTSKYKSEFLSSMSHELRTPLNSLLILAQKIAENGQHNLTNDQVKYATTIYESGKDLLTLINEILDLAKIESGTVQINTGDVTFSRITDFLDRNYRHVAEKNGLDFSISLSPSLPASIRSDETRLFQVLRNLLNNACKFTDRGRVSVDIASVTHGWNAASESLASARQVIAFVVRDTGIGINEEQQELVFEAFQQADTGTAKSYGGTGLGLSISREIARLLGGELELAQSSPDHGSTFVLYLPLEAPAPKNTKPKSKAIEERLAASPMLVETAPALAASSLNAKEESARWDTLEQPPEQPVWQELNSDQIEVSATEDDRSSLEAGNRTLLVIEDDTNLCEMIKEVAHELKLKCLIAKTGQEGIELAQLHHPDLISLDIFLPDLGGWSVLTWLKTQPELQATPVLVVTSQPDAEHGWGLGAYQVKQKPLTRAQIKAMLKDANTFGTLPKQCILLTQDDSALVQSPMITELCEAGVVTHTNDASNALEMLASGDYQVCLIDCESMDPTPELVASLERTAREQPFSQLVLFGEHAALQELERSPWITGTHSNDHLASTLARNLHLPLDTWPVTMKQLVDERRNVHASLAGKKVLVVDDDARNIFALTAILEDEGVEVLSADGGMKGIELLEKNPDTSLVLMDIMMPGMDGYDTMARIRENPLFKNLPIIAVTAKIMRGDREACISRGASDYLSKPITVPRQLINLMSLWIAV